MCCLPAPSRWFRWISSALFPAFSAINLCELNLLLSVSFRCSLNGFSNRRWWLWVRVEVKTITLNGQNDEVLSKQITENGTGLIEFWMWMASQQSISRQKWREKLPENKAVCINRPAVMQPNYLPRPALQIGTDCVCNHSTNDSEAVELLLEQYEMLQPVRLTKNKNKLWFRSIGSASSSSSGSSHYPPIFSSLWNETFPDSCRIGQGRPAQKFKERRKWERRYERDKHGEYCIIHRKDKKRKILIRR